MKRDQQRRFLAPFRRLRWKMTGSYTAVTVGALVALEILIIAGGLITVNHFFRSPLMARAMEGSYSLTLVGALRPHLRESPMDSEGLQTTVDLYSEEDEAEIFVVDSKGVVIATSSQFDNARGSPYTSLQTESLHPLVEAALSESALAQRFDFVDGRILLVTPIVEEESGELLGALGLTNPVPTVDQGLLRRIAPLVGASLVFFTMGTGLIGALFGFLTSRPLVRRLDRLAAVSGSWSRGDFTVFVHDEGGDEIAALGRHMNRMAERLQNLLEERNRLAILEERHRIARDLHDSVKQQAFAAAGQIGAAKALLTQDYRAAEEHLKEAEDLVYVLRQELTLLVEELRPAALEEKGLGAALQEYVDRWSRRSGIDGEVEITCDATLSVETEQALFRIAQETLANVARHSEATRVHLSLDCEDENLRLRVVDNGVGFDPQRVTAGFGLSSVRQRVAALEEGALTIHSEPGAGTTVEVWAAIAARR